ncbi:protein serine/threonine phosphatase 2C, partial [Rhizodiscina lignyota]
RFSYGLSASYSAKRQRLDPERNLYTFDPYVRLKKTATELRNGPKDKKSRPQSGQDAFFISSVGDTDSIAFGVVDGVGGWEESGVDPADFAHGLCDYMASAARTFPEGFNTSEARPKDLLEIGYLKVMEDMSIAAGGSTACVATVDSAGHLEVANLGDSGFIHFGLNAVRYVSPPQTHAFNTPYQLSKLPPKMLEQMKLFQGGAKPFAEHPDDSAITDHQMRHGDVLIFATDGVWDNLSPQDTLEIVNRVMVSAGAWVESSDGVEVGEPLRRLSKRAAGQTSNRDEVNLTAVLALAITKEAKEASLNTKRDGPFAREVQRLYPAENWRGGKADDICAVVAIAIEE